MLIKVKMPTIVGILTFIIWINTTYEGFFAPLLTFKARNIVFVHHLTFYEHLKFRAQTS